MEIVGLTGSIGTGKSTAASMLADMGLPVFDADAAVHRLLGPRGRALPAIAAEFPQAIVRGPEGPSADRSALGAQVFADNAALSRLETILHPLVRGLERDFLARTRRRNASVCILDIPLLFETGGDRRCDATIVVTAPFFLQAQRVLRRPGMSQERLQQVLARQMPVSEKCRRADFVVPTGLGFADTRRRLSWIVTHLRGTP